jgi:hypothetical protein
MDGVLMSDTYALIRKEIVSAMKAKDAGRLMALRQLDTAIKNLAISMGHKDGPTEEDATKSLSQLIKRGKDSCEQFLKGNRQDLADVENYQVGVFKEFLPEQADPAEVETGISTIIKEYQMANGQALSVQKDFGKLMKMAADKFKGKADNSTISSILRESIVKATLAIMLIMSVHSRAGIVTHAIAYEMGKESAGETEKKPAPISFDSDKVCRCDTYGKGCVVNVLNSDGFYKNREISMRAYIMMHCGAPCIVEPRRRSL